MKFLHLSALLLLSSLLVVVSFAPQTTSSSWMQRTASDSSSTRILAHNNDPSSSSWDRRSVVQSILAGATTPLIASSSSPAQAILPYDLDCLLDLPALDPDSVRIYLCRHAQTENNRLRIVQGSRVDPPINYNGIQQSLRLGSALARLRDACPTMICHSPLVRSKETAEYAARNIVDKDIDLAPMAYLAEVDFGPRADGLPMADVRRSMLRTYGAWASGYIDVQPEGGGECGRQVLTRSATALQSLVQQAEANGGTIAAVAHSKFLKVLLAVVQDEPLGSTVSIQQANGCIDVLDMKKNSTMITLGPNSNLFGGHLSNAPTDFALQVPQGKVTRINEKRHLEDLDFETMVA